MCWTQAIEKLAQRGAVEILLHLSEVRKDPTRATQPEYQRTFTGYYKMGKKKAEFYDAFFEVLENVAAKRLPASLKKVLEYLFKRTGQRHLSFGSKLLATVDDSAVIYDRNVASYFGVPSTPLPKERWLDEALRRYELIRKGICGFTEAPQWPQIKGLFDKAFSQAQHLSDVRKADLLIWAAYDPQG